MKSLEKIGRRLGRRKQERTLRSIISLWCIVFGYTVIAVILETSGVISETVALAPLAIVLSLNLFIATMLVLFIGFAEIYYLLKGE